MATKCRGAKKCCCKCAFSLKLEGCGTKTCKVCVNKNVGHVCIMGHMIDHDYIAHHFANAHGECEMWTDRKEYPDILYALKDLLKQAITEHSHYYTANVLRETIVKIEKYQAEYNRNELILIQKGG